LQFFQKMLNWYYKILNLDCHAILTIFLHHNFFFLHIKNYARYKTFGKTFWGLSIPSHCSQWLKPPWNVEPNHWEQYWVTFDLVPLKMETPSTPIDIFVKPFSYIEVCIRIWVRLSTLDPTTMCSKHKKIGICNQFWTT
jgi:hypothetical protein